MTTNSVPSDSPDDLLINARNIDRFVNDPALSFADRLGIARKTIAGHSADAAAVLAAAVLGFQGSAAAAVLSLAAFNARGAWATGAVYALKDVTVQGGIAYVCVTAHTAGTFATDLAAGKWVVHQGATREELAVTPRQFGAACNGITDDTTAILAAIATGRSVDFGGVENTYLISSSLTPSTGQHLFGRGATIKTAANIALITLASRCVVSGLRLVGNNTGAAQRGIFIDGGTTWDAVSRTTVRDCQISNMGADGYYVTRVVDAHQGNHLIGGDIDGCATGVHIAERGEYTTVTGVNISGCTVGYDVAGGNANITGGCVSNCGTNIKISRGSNDAHGSVNGVLCNHATQYAVYVDNPAADEFQFNGCKFYFGDLFFYRSTGMQFHDCVFSSNGHIYFQGSIDTLFDTCRFRTAPTFHNSYNSEPSKTWWLNTVPSNALTTGLSSISENGAYVLVQRPTTNALLTASTGQQVVPFDSLTLNAVPNDLAYTYELFFDTSTNTFNLQNYKQPGAGFYCDADIELSIGAASGSIDYDKINVYLWDSIQNRIMANFTPSPREFGANPGLSWKIYSLNARVQKRNGLKIIVENNSGVALTLWHEQGNNIPFRAAFSGF